MRVAEPRRVVHELAVVLHLAHELALTTRPIDQMPDTPEPGAHVASKIAAMASAIRW